MFQCFVCSQMYIPSQMANHGSANVVYPITQVDFPDNMADLVDAVKVEAKAEDGGVVSENNIRVFCKVCYTPIVPSGGKGFPLGVLRPLNRNAIKEADGSPASYPSFESECISYLYIFQYFSAFVTPDTPFPLFALLQPKESTPMSTFPSPTSQKRFQIQ